MHRALPVTSDRDTLSQTDLQLSSHTVDALGQSSLSEKNAVPIGQLYQRACQGDLGSVLSQRHRVLPDASGLL